jgi:hypothetical protein
MFFEEVRMFQREFEEIDKQWNTPKQLMKAEEGIIALKKKIDGSGALLELSKYLFYRQHVVDIPEEQEIVHTIDVEGLGRELVEKLQIKHFKQLEEKRIQMEDLKKNLELKHKNEIEAQRVVLENDIKVLKEKEQIKRDLTRETLQIKIDELEKSKNDLEKIFEKKENELDKIKEEEKEMLGIIKDWWWKKVQTIQFEKIYTKYFPYSTIIDKEELTLNFNEERVESLMKDCFENEVKLPNLKKLEIINADDDPVLAEFLEKCSPLNLEILVFNMNGRNTINATKFVDSFENCLSWVTKQIFFWKFNFNSTKEFEKFIKASRNCSKLVIRRSRINTDEEWNFDETINYKTIGINLSDWSSEKYYQWEGDAKYFKNIALGISKWNLKTSLTNFGVSSSEISQKDCEEIFKELKCENISFEVGYEIPMKI